MSADDAAREPSDLYELRQAAHAMLDAMYGFDEAVTKCMSLGDRFPLHEVATLDASKAQRWAKRVGFTITRRELGGVAKVSRVNDATLVDPRDALDGILKWLMATSIALIDVHAVFDNLFDSLEEEFAEPYTDLCEFIGVTGRSFCKALTEQVRALVRTVFEGIDKFTPEDEFDRNVDEDQQGFTASNWYPTCQLILMRFPDLGVPEVVHDVAEREFDTIWRCRVACDGVEADLAAAVAGKGDENKVDDLHDLSNRVRVNFETFAVEWQDRKAFFKDCRSKLLFVLLARLAKRPGRGVMYDALRGVGAVWSDGQTSDSTIDGAVHRLRQWLGNHNLKEVASRIRVGRVDHQKFVILNTDSFSPNSQ